MPLASITSSVYTPGAIPSIDVVPCPNAIARTAGPPVSRARPTPLATMVSAPPLLNPMRTAGPGTENSILGEATY